MTEAPSSVPFIHTIFLCLSPSATDHAPPLNVTNHPISHMLPPTCPHRCVHICHQSTMRAPHSREGKGTHVNALQASNHNHGHTHCKGLCVLERLMATGDWTLTHRQRWGHACTPMNLYMHIHTHTPSQIHFLAHMWPGWTIGW